MTRVVFKNLRRYTRDHTFHVKNIWPKYNISYEREMIVIFVQTLMSARESKLSWEEANN